jgi:16S rRNA processing protein RimM
VTERFTAGLVGAPFGVKGLVKVHSPSGETDHLLRLRSASLRLKGREQSFDIDESSPVTGGVVVKFRGVDTPEAAKALTGAELLVDRAHAAPLGEDEFYVEDLRGMAVIVRDEAGTGEEAVGEITGVAEGGGAIWWNCGLNRGNCGWFPLGKNFSAPWISPAAGRRF